MTFAKTQAANIQKIQPLLAKLVEINPERIVRDDLGPALSFRSERDNIERALTACKKLQNVPFEGIPPNLWDDVVSFVMAIHEFVTQAEGFSGEEGSYGRNQIVWTLESALESHYSGTITAIGVSQTLYSPVDVAVREAQGMLEALRRQASQMETRVKEISEAADRALASAQEAAALKGITQHAQHFHQEAREHATAGKRWLRITISLAFGTILVAVVALAEAILSPPRTLDAAVAAAFPRILVFSGFLTTAIWAGRVYRAHLHNYVVNRHRANALSTFQTFADAAQGDVRNSVLLQSVQAVFAPQHSGFSPSDSEPVAAIPPVDAARGVFGRS